MILDCDLTVLCSKLSLVAAMHASSYLENSVYIFSTNFLVEACMCEPDNS